jgi:hypothetical protein
MDTVVNFTVRGDKVFWRSDERISRGSIVGRSGDTVSVEFRDTTIYEIGELVRVRQIEKGLWTINFRDGLSKDAKGWWLVLLVEQRGDRIMVHTFSDQMDSRPSLVGELTGMYFFDTGLTASEIRNMMRDSLYTPYLELVRVEQSR